MLKGFSSYVIELKCDHELEKTVHIKLHLVSDNPVNFAAIPNWNGSIGKAILWLVFLELEDGDVLRMLIAHS